MTLDLQNQAWLSMVLVIKIIFQPIGGLTDWKTGEI